MEGVVEATIFGPDKIQEGRGMNLVVLKFNKEITLACRRLKKQKIRDVAFVMNRPIKVILGAGFKGVPRIADNKEGMGYRGIRLFYDPSLPESKHGFFFDYQHLIKKYNALQEQGV